MNYVLNHGKKTANKLAILLVFAAFFSFSLCATAAAQQVREYHIKAVFLLNLAHFVNWSPETIEDTGKREFFDIGVYGPDPFGEILDQAVKGEKKGDMPIKIRRFSSLDELKNSSCKILFISSDSLNDWQNIHTILAGTQTLTISDSAGFPEQGGMVNLLKMGNKIQVEVNHNMVRKAGLSMSAKLLKLARLVE